MKQLTIQPLTAPMLPDVVELDRLCFGGLWTEDGYRRELESDCSELIVLTPNSQSPLTEFQEGEKTSPLPDPRSPLAKRSEGLADPPIGIGCLWAILEEAHITILGIHPDYQGQGLGQAMLLALLTIAHQRGLEWVTLEVKASNEGAIALYQKFGFEVVGRRRNYYPDTGEDALILWLKGLKKSEFKNWLGSWEKKVGDRLFQSGWQLVLDEKEVYFPKKSLDLKRHP